MNLRAYSGAALLASVTLVLPTAAAVQAAPSSPVSAAATPKPVPGDDGLSRSATPNVTRTHARVAGSDPAAAARSFLAERRSTYRITDPARDLRTVSRTSEQGITTVRLAQRYHGLPVTGAQYAVRMKDQGTSNVVTGTSGQYFSALAVDTSHPLGFHLAKVAALHALADVRWKTPPKVTDEGSEIVPVGKGALTRHVTVQGYDLVRKKAVRRQLYIHAHTGKPVLSFDDIAYEGPVDTTGASVNGGSVPLHAYRTATGFELRDRTRDMFAADGGEILTRDAKGADFGLFVDEELPPRLKPVTSSTIPFPASKKSGANDAHWALGEVYEFYKHLGRNSIDGNGGSINAVVGVTDFGFPFPNAFWNGTYMVFGAGGFGFKPFSASLDVVGHELTHGVVQHTSDLMYLGQSGAANEAAADYLGNAIQNDVEHIAPDSPLDGLLGDQLCATGPRVDCFDRDLNAPVTTSDFISTPEDNGGVHLNSTIVSGSWWQIRHAFQADPSLSDGADVADRLVYKTVSSYLTPFSQFLDVRDATVAAAQDSGLNDAQVADVRQAFADHGIVDSWEHDALGADFRPLREIVGYPFIYPRVANGSWYASDNLTADEAYPSIVTGSLDGSVPASRFSPQENAYFDNPDADGTTVVWTKTRDTDGRTYIQTKPVAGGPVTTEDFVEVPFVFNVRISGQTIAYSAPNFGTDRVEVTVLKPDGTARTIRAANGRNLLFPDVQGTKVVYATILDSQKRIRIMEYDAATDTKKSLGLITSSHRMGMADLTVTANHVVFSLDKSLRTARTGIVVMHRDGSHRHWLVKDTGARAPKVPMLTATDQAVSFTDVDLTSDWFDTHLRQIPTAGGAITQVSCSKAYKGAPASDTGAGVAWVDFTGGKSQIVDQDSPVGTCGG